MTNQQPAIACRPGCAACCIAPSISSPIPDPQGGPARPKPAGIPCGQLDEQLRCRLFGQPGRPAVCSQLAPAVDMCGSDPDPAREDFLISHGFIERLGNSRLRCTPSGMLILDSVVADLAC